MAKLEDIVNHFDVSRKAIVGINHFAFDSMSSINADKQKDFFALLLKPPVGRTTSSSRENKDWEIDFFLFDLWNENAESETRKIQQVWTALEDKARELLNKILENRQTYGLVNPSREPSVEYGYPMGNDRMVGVRFKFTMRAFYGC